VSFTRKRGLSLFDTVNAVFVALVSAACLLPFVYVVSLSLTSEHVYVPFDFRFFPKKLSLEAYTYMLSTRSFGDALYSTVFVTAVGTALNILFTFTAAYGLTKRELPHRRLINGLIVFTLVFNPGILPNYLLVRSLGLLDSYWALILPALSNAWSLIVVRSFMESLPKELEDAACIDGCNDLMVFSRIIIPLSMASIAAFTLFFAVAHWNTYFEALIYISSSRKRTLQVLVKALILDASSNLAGSTASYTDEIVVPSEILRVASVVLAMLPILILYPFLQKYFVKGVMLGSIKG
jgi:putative aldouronate transport system permease protein